MGCVWAQSRQNISLARRNAEEARLAANPSSSTEEVRAQDEVLSKLEALENKYMLQPAPSDGPAMKIPFLLRLKFMFIGKRNLKAILRELQRCNEALEAKRRTIGCTPAFPVHRINSMNAENHPATCPIASPQVDEGSPQANEGSLQADEGSLQADEGSLLAGEGSSQAGEGSSATSSLGKMSPRGDFESPTSSISEHEDTYCVHKSEGD